MDVYSDLGIKFNAATGFYSDASATSGYSAHGTYGGGLLVRPGCVVDGLWYFNQYHPPYYTSFTLESLFPRKGAPCPDFAKLLGRLARFDYAGLYMHPHMALKLKHWDGPNYRYGNNCEWRKWQQVEDRDPADTAVFYERLKALIRALKADERFEMTDIGEMERKLKPRRTITAAEIPAIRKALAKDFNTIREPASWSVADAFQAAVKLLRGEREYVPGKVYGFLERPRGVQSETTVSVADLKATAARIDLSTFLPPEISVGGATIGPADFLFAALEVLDTGAETVKVLPREQLGSFKEVPAIEAMNISGKWLHTKEFTDKFLSERLRLQLWTLRIE